MHIYICDDEQQILNLLSEKIESYLPNDMVTGFTSGHRLMEAMNRLPCDILFLDIDLKELNGMDIAYQLNGRKQKPLLIFVTSHDELVYESLQCHPFGFIRKNHFAEEIEKILEDCKKELYSREKYFYFRMAGQEVRVLLSDILYFEADGNYLRLYAKAEQYRFRSTVAAAENTLAGNGFLRVHKGFLVNLSAVRRLGNEDIRLISGHVIPLGKNYTDSVRERFLEAMRL